MAGGTIGTVFVAVVPSTKGFGAKAKKQIEAEAASLATAAQASAAKQMAKGGGLLGNVLGPDHKRRWAEYEKFLKEQEKAAADSLRRQEKAEEASLQRRAKEARERFDQAIRSENDLADHHADRLREEERRERAHQKRLNSQIAESMQQRADFQRELSEKSHREEMDAERSRASEMARLREDILSRDTIGKGLTQNQADARQIGRDFINTAFNPQDMTHAVGRQMSNAGRRMTFSGSIAAALPIAAAGYFAAKFESELGRTMSVIDGGKFFGDTAQTEQLRQAAMRVSRDNPFTNIDVAQGMSELARAGLSYNEVLAGIEPATDIAIAGQMDLATASHTVAAAMGQFGLSAKDIPRIGDAMAVAANKSNASLQDLALSMEYVGPVAGSAGISLEETNAMLGLLGKQGIIASKAGTTLRSAFMSLASPTDQNKALMKELGINIAYTSGKMKGQIKPLAGIADELHRATKGMSEVEKQDFLGSMFGKYGSAAGRILAKGGDELRKFVNEIENSEGAAKKLADRSMSPLELAFRKLQGSVENFLVSFGNAMAPAMIVVADAIAALTDAMSKMPKGALIALGTALTGIALAGPALWAAGGTIAGLKAIMGVTKGLKTALGGLGAINLLAGGKKGGALGGVAYLAKSLGSIDFAKVGKGLLKKGIWTTVLFEAWDSMAEGFNFAQQQNPLEVKPPKFSQEWKDQKYLKEGFQSKALKDAGAVPGGDFFKEITQGAGAAISAVQDLVGAIWEITSLGAIFTSIGASLGMVDWGDFISGATNAMGNVTQAINQVRIALLGVQIEAKETWAGMLDAMNLENQAAAVRAGIKGLEDEQAAIQKENRDIDLRTEMNMLPEGDQVRIDKALSAAEQAAKQVETWAKRRVINLEMKTALSINKAAGKVFKGAGLDAFGLGVPDSKIRAKYAKQREALDKEMNKGGGPKVDIQPKTGQGKRAVEKSVNSGKPISIKVQAKLDDAKTKIKSLRQQLGELDQGKKGKVNVKANVTGRGEVRDLKQAIKGLKNERVSVKVKDVNEGKQDVQALIEKLENLSGKSPTTVTVKQTGAEDAASQVSFLIMKLAALDSMAPVVTVSIQADATGYYEALASLPTQQSAGGGGGGVASPEAYGVSAASREGISTYAPQPGGGGGGGGGGKKGSVSTSLGGILDQIIAFSKNLQGMGVQAIKQGMDAIKDAIGNKKWGDDAKKQIDKEMEKLRQTMEKRTSELRDIRDKMFSELSGNAIDPRWLGRDGDSSSLGDVWRGVEDNLVLAIEQLNGKGLNKAAKKAEKARRNQLKKTVRAYRAEAKASLKELRNIDKAKDFRDSLLESSQNSADLSRVRSGGSLANYLNRMTTALTSAKDGAVALAKAGVPSSLLQQIMQQDPLTAAKWMKRLQAMTPEDLNALKEKWNQYQQAGKNYASYGTEAAFGSPGEAFEDGLLSREKELKKFFNRMGRQMAESFEIALGLDNTKWNNSPAQKRLKGEVDAQAQNRPRRWRNNGQNGARPDPRGRNDGGVNVTVIGKPDESAKDLARKTGRELSWKQKKRRNRR